MSISLYINTVISYCINLRKSKERVGVETSSLFTRFGGRPLEHNSSKTDDNKAQRRQTGAGDGVLRKAAVKTTWGREHILGSIKVSFLR